MSPSRNTAPRKSPPQLLPFTDGLLRPAAFGDLAAIRELVRDSFPEGEAGDAAGSLGHHFACRCHGIADGREPWVIETVGALAGLAGLYAPPWDGTSGAWLSWVAVRPDCRRMGFGTRLVGLMADRAAVGGNSALYVETYTGDAYAPARDFYEALGFRPAGRIAASGPRGEDALVLVLKLTS